MKNVTGLTWTESVTKMRGMRYVSDTYGFGMETSEDCQKAKKDMRGISVEQKRVGKTLCLPR